MIATPTELPEVIALEPEVFSDERGSFMESFNLRRFGELVGEAPAFVQDNHSRSVGNVIRGLHYQIQEAQGKLVRCVVGRVFDVAVDVRASSPRFGQWAGLELSADNYRQLWIPEGFAHGFLAMSEPVEVLYKATAYYAREHERSILWSDPAIGIAWPLRGDPVLSDKDAAAPLLGDAEVFA